MGSESECRFLVQRVLGRLDYGQEKSYSQNILAFKGAPGNILGVARRTFNRLKSFLSRNVISRRQDWFWLFKEKRLGGLAQNEQVCMTCLMTMSKGPICF